MKRMSVFLTITAVVMILTAGVSSAWGYFTSFSEAKGGVPIKLGSQTEMNESFSSSSWIKHVSVYADPDSQPVYVRVKAFCAGGYTLVYSSEKRSWTENTQDGYWYYNGILSGGQTTPEFLVKIEGVPKNSTLTDGAQFDVVVVYETTPVLYDADGNPYADWTFQLDNGEGGDS